MGCSVHRGVTPISRTPLVNIHFEWSSHLCPSYERYRLIKRDRQPVDCPRITLFCSVCLVYGYHVSVHNTAFANNRQPIIQPYTTAKTIMKRCKPRIKEVIADHPFYMCLALKEHAENGDTSLHLLFNGRIGRPVSKV
uniref:Uncharacterized protein LOC114345238 n=1 Tax=Diabrotica virgifera virgifera TaxID=50390 RepID=A0A6P7GPN1_DIAVI